MQRLWSHASDILVVVEPGTPLGSSIVRAARSTVLQFEARKVRTAAKRAAAAPEAGASESAASAAGAGGAAFAADEQPAIIGAHVVAPCAHDKRCPMDGTDWWCHFSQRLQRPDTQRAVKGGASARTYQVRVAHAKPYIAADAHRVSRTSASRTWCCVAACGRQEARRRLQRLLLLRKSTMSLTSRMTMTRRRTAMTKASWMAKMGVLLSRSPPPKHLPLLLLLQPPDGRELYGRRISARATSCLSCALLVAACSNKLSQPRTTSCSGPAAIAWHARRDGATPGRILQWCGEPASTMKATGALRWRRQTKATR